MEPYSLSRLVRPCDVEPFLRDSWAQAPCFCPQSLGSDADKILNLASFELVLATLNRAHEGWLHFACGGRKMVPQEMVDAEGLLDLRKVRAAFAGGETLYLTKAERLSAPLMRLCRALELDLVARGVGLRQSVGAHVFLTPPGTQGFPAHRDEHASFVLQLDGSKEWTVYEPSAADSSNGLLRPGAVDSASLGALKPHTYLLEQGDVLYMPEWWPHEATASRSHSLHVTLRVFPLRWADLMLELCSEHPALSAVVPRTVATNPEAMVEPLVDLLGSAAFREKLPAMLETISRRHGVPRTALPDDGLRQVLQVERIELDTPLVRDAATACRVFEAGEAVCIAFPGGVIRGPAVIKEVFEYVAGATALRPRDLPSLVVGPSYDRLDVARTMVKDGLLRIDGTDS